MSDLLNGKNILIIGIGLHGGGEAAIRFCLTQGAHVRVTDLKKKRALSSVIGKFPHLVGTYGMHSKKDVDWADYCIKNPGVPKESPILHYARKQQKPIFSPLDLFFDKHKKRIDIAVTGTRGKSTTTALIAHIIKSKKPVFVAGNNRVSVLAKKSVSKKTTIMELSSWQIEDTHNPLLSPRIGIFTNIYQDHLNRYQNMRGYFEAKASLFSSQTSSDISILNYDQMRLRRFANSLNTRKLFFSLNPLPRTVSGCFVKDEYVLLRSKNTTRKICLITDLKIFGKHNLQNVCAAVCASAAYGISVRDIKKQLRTFRGLPGRLELIRTVRGVKYINDTTSTSPDALRNAVEALRIRYPKASLHVIAGGASKKLSYAPCLFLKKYSAIRFYLLSGTATADLAGTLMKEQVSGTYTSLSKAVTESKKAALSGDIVVLSPGAASFGMFLHEFDRGEKFNRIVRRLR